MITLISRPCHVCIPRCGVYGRREEIIYATLTVLLVEQDLELISEVMVERAVYALNRLLLGEFAVHPSAAA